MKRINLFAGFMFIALIASSVLLFMSRNVGFGFVNLFTAIYILIS